MLIVKPSVQFLNKASDSVVITITGGVLVGLTDNGYFPAPTPGLPVIQTALDEFSDALIAASGGGRLLTVIKNAKRAALVAVMRPLAHYIAVACHGDMAALVSSTFPIQKSQATPVGQLPAPSGLTVKHGWKTGTLDVAVVRLAGAGSHNWRVARAAAPDVVVQLVQTKGARATLTGLTPGVLYLIQCNVVGTAGVSNWCGPVPRMVV